MAVSSDRWMSRRDPDSPILAVNKSKSGKYSVFELPLKQILDTTGNSSCTGRLWYRIGMLRHSFRREREIIFFLGLRNKKDYVGKMIKENKVDIMCLQEIDIEPNYPHNILNFKGYDFLTENNSLKARAGMYINKSSAWKWHYSFSKEIFSLGEFSGSKHFFENCVSYCKRGPNLDLRWTKALSGNFFTVLKLSCPQLVDNSTYGTIAFPCIKSSLLTPMTKVEWTQELSGHLLHDVPKQISPLKLSKLKSFSRSV